MYRTSDGVLHETEQKARAHCENNMGKILSLRGGQLAQIDKSSAAVDFLEKHLADFTLAHKWQMESQESLSFE